jgi:hypothetical protein
MSAMLQPKRFQLTEDQVGAALALANIHPTKRSMLPDAATAAKPATLLKGAGVLAGRSSKLDADVETALRIAADPSHMLSLIANNADEENWVETSFLHGNQDDAYISLASADKKYDFELLPTAAQAVVLIDDLLGLTAMVARPGKPQVELDLAGYGAVLAMADAMQAARLQSRLERKRYPQPKFEPQILEDQLKKGLQSTDTRWAVTAGRLICPTQFRLALGKMPQGLKQLEKGGFLKKGPEGYALTEEGFMLGSGLGQLIHTGGLSLVIGKKDNQLTIAHAGLFRTAFSIWIMTWSNVSGGDAHGDLFQVSSSSAVGFIRNFLSPLNMLRSIEEEIPRPEKTPAKVPEAQSAVAATAPAATSQAPTAPAAKAAATVTAPPADVTCRYCGKKNKAGQAVCSGCGRELPRQVAPAPSGPAPCRHCGKVNAPDARFCNGCGKEI